MDPLDGLKGIKRDDSFSLSNKFRKVKIWNCEREERTTRKKKKEGEEKIEGKTENNDRRWWRNETIFLVPRGIRDMCIHRSIQMGRSGYAFKESAYDGKVSRRVACTYVDSHIYIYTLYIRIYTGNEMLGDERMLDVLRARRCSRVTLAEASSSIFAGIYFRYGLSRMYEAIQIFKLSFVRQIFSRYLRMKRNVEWNKSFGIFNKSCVKKRKKMWISRVVAEERKILLFFPPFFVFPLRPIRFDTFTNEKRIKKKKRGKKEKGWI